MKRTGILSLTAILLAGLPIFPAVRQVRVTAQRAGIYAEPNRNSTRLDIVQKDDLLNLFQQQKVKEIWYYVSYVSSRYGGRMSGFILDSAVEPVQEGAPAGAKPVVPAPSPEKPPVSAAPPAPAVAQKPAVEDVGVPKKAGPELPAKPGIAKDIPRPPEVIVVTGITRAPRAKRLTLPRKGAGPIDLPWDILEPPAMKPVMPPPVITAPAPAVVHEPVAVEAPAVPQKAEIAPAAKKPAITKEKPVVAEVSVVTGTSRAPRAKRVSLPRRPAVLKDMPWATVQPPPPEPKAQVIAAAPTPPAPAKVVTSKAETRIEPKAKIKKPPSTKPEPPAGRETPAESKAAPAAEAARTKPVVPRPSEASPPPAPQAKPPQPMRATGDGPPPSRFGLAFGFGPSFGGAGGSLQVNLSRGLALHAGYGVYPTTVIYSETDWVKNEALWSAGLKIYPFPSSKQIAPYIDAQYGGFMVEAAQVITGIYDYSFVYNLEQKTLWGPSLLAGLEIRFGRFALSGGAGASYSLTNWDVLESRVFFAFEAGVGMRL